MSEEAENISGNSVYPMNEISKTQKDPRFLRGKALLKETRYEEAVQYFGELLESLNSTCQDSNSLVLAPVYYEYGNSLLLNIESSADVFGDQIEKAKEAVRSAFSEQSQDKEISQEEADTTSEDLELSWEMLEVARVIYCHHQERLKQVEEKDLLKSVEAELTRVYTRLGDLGMESGVFMQAKNDYERSLSLHEVASNKWDRSLADLHCCIAMSCIYQASSVESPDEAKKMKEEGLIHYVNAGQTIALNIDKSLEAFNEKVRKIVVDAIPKNFSNSASVKGKGKSPRFNDTDPLPLMKNIDELRDALKREMNIDGQDIAQIKNVLDLLDIYNELKEKALGVRESLKTPVEDSSSGVTTIGFGNQGDNKENEQATSTLSTNVIATVPLVRKKARPTRDSPTGEADSKKRNQEMASEDKEQEEKTAKKSKH